MTRAGGTMRPSSTADEAVVPYSFMVPSRRKEADSGDLVSARLAQPVGLDTLGSPFVRYGFVSLPFFV